MQMENVQNVDYVKELKLKEHFVCCLFLYFWVLAKGFQDKCVRFTTFKILIHVHTLKKNNLLIQVLQGAIEGSGVV